MILGTENGSPSYLQTHSSGSAGAPRVVKLIDGNDGGFVNDDLGHNLLQSSNNRCHAAVLQYHGVLSHTYKCT